MKTRKKFIRYRVYVLSLCLRLCLQQCGKGLYFISCRRLCTFHVCMQCVPVCVLHVILTLLYVPVTCPCTCPCTARDFAPALRSFLPVPGCVLHVISPLLYVPVACQCVCTTRDFVANTHVLATRALVFPCLL